MRRVRCKRKVSAARVQASQRWAVSNRPRRKRCPVCARGWLHCQRELLAMVQRGWSVAAGAIDTIHCVQLRQRYRAKGGTREIDRPRRLPCRGR